MQSRGDGSAVAVAPGVLWLRMPLFAALPWINVWAIADGGGWAIVDTGLKTAQTLSAWEAAFSQALGSAQVTRVLVTHMHPDHCGMAGWIAERFHARLWMSRLEYLSCRLMAADTGRSAPVDGIGFYRAAGWDEEAIKRFQEKFGSFGEMIHPLPDSYRRLTDGDTLRFGSHEWLVVVGSGHSPEHACLYCPELKLLISGDHRCTAARPLLSNGNAARSRRPRAIRCHLWQIVVRPHPLRTRSRYIFEACHVEHGDAARSLHDSPEAAAKRRAEFGHGKGGTSSVAPMDKVVEQRLFSDFQCDLEVAGGASVHSSRLLFQ